MPEAFGQKPAIDPARAIARERALFEEIGRLKMELEWLRMKLVHLGTVERRTMIDPKTSRHHEAP